MRRRQLSISTIMADLDGFSLVCGKKATKLRKQHNHSVSTKQAREDLEHFDLLRFKQRLDSCIQEVVTSQFFLSSYDTVISAISVLVQDVTASGDREQSEDSLQNYPKTAPDPVDGKGSAAGVTSMASGIIHKNLPLPQSDNPSLPQSSNPSPPSTNPPLSQFASPLPQSTNHSLPQSTNPSLQQFTNSSLPQSPNSSLPQSTNSSLPQSTNSSLPQSINHLPQSSNPLLQATNPLPPSNNHLLQSSNPPLPQTTESLDQYLSSQLEPLSLIKDGPQNIHLLSYGIGNFTTCLIARYQLAFLLAFRAKLGKMCSQSCVYDPVFSTQEKVVLEMYNCHVISDNEEGMRECTALTVAFLPHCGKALYNNLLWRNLATDQGEGLSRLVLIGNSFSNILERTPKRVLAKTGNYIIKLCPFMKEVHLANSFTHKDVFNDMSIHYMPQPQLVAALQHIGENLEKPHYEEDDAEFISK